MTSDLVGETDRRPIERCPVCLESGREPWLRSFGFDLVRCAACGHRYATEVFVASELAGGYYDEPAPDIKARSLAAKRDRFVEYEALFRRYLPPRGRVLDVGCNAGELLGLFKERGFSVAGVEPSPGPARFAAQTLGAPIWQGHVESALPDDEHFDLVTMSHVLEHLEDPGRVLDRLRRTISSGGGLLVEVPNAADVMLDLWRGSYRPLCPGDHVSFFDSQSLRRLLRAHGYRIAEMVSPTHARDIVYTSLLSGVDRVGAVLQSRRGRPASSGVKGQTRYRGRLRRPLRSAFDHFVAAVDPLVVLAASSFERRDRGPVLIALACPMGRDAQGRS